MRKRSPCRRGELLVGYDDDANEAWSSWLSFERERLTTAWRDAALKHLSADLQPAEAIELSAQLLNADPLDEAALRAHMEWLARNGQMAQARRAYREFAERLQKDIGLAPGVEAKSLHDSLERLSASSTIRVPAVAESHHVGFIGRSVELRRISALLAQDECRLLCLIGPGGIGKTRLAQRALQELILGYRDGGAFVPLEDAVSAQDLVSALAREAGVRLGGGGSPLDQLIGELRERQMLLVLDNFEHLATDASMLEAVLKSCAGLKLIVTSRVRLGLGMEWLFPVEGLPYPEQEDLDRLEAFDAARLFISVAQRVEPSLVPSAEATAICDICRIVEGLPLALELAAGWTRTLSCAEIAFELGQGTDLLRAIDPARPARQASMEVVFEQSWRLLTATERDALTGFPSFGEAFRHKQRAQSPLRRCRY